MADRKITQIRTEALKKGYHVHYPGYHCKKATIVPINGVNEKCLQIDMSDPVRGLHQLETTIAIIADRNKCICTQLTALEPTVNPDCPVHGSMQRSCK